MDDARSAWREVCMVEYRITGDMDKATRFADSVEQRFRAATLREAADKLEEVDPVEWALAGQMAGMDAAVMLRRMAEETP